MKTIITLAAALALSGCSRIERAANAFIEPAWKSAPIIEVPDENIYALYRNSLVVTSSQRVHIATFNADEKATYNQENCLVAAGLFQRQPGVQTRFWCERGPFKP